MIRDLISEFLNSWPEEKKEIILEQASNKDYNVKLKKRGAYTSP
ncbi:hypothetical protein SAMN05444410_108164 [Hydrobacter penzbergensis]|uniref:Uncharacterized protein n=1 Tax=Hydrobacter penzbergensis TaxID=1235997 RepID=A0A8X8IFH2_9BACT|nr:hypothetical protein SAMN05444410_108164 [Hydrobacter penzbergensis]